MIGLMGEIHYSINPLLITFAFLICPRNTRKTQNGFMPKALDTHSITGLNFSNN
jgi:hypothetical protein